MKVWTPLTQLPRPLVLTHWHNSLTPFTPHRSTLNIQQIFPECTCIIDTPKRFIVWNHHCLLDGQTKHFKHKHIIVLTSNFSNPLLRRTDIHCLLLKHHNIILGTFITRAHQVVRENQRERGSMQAQENSVTFSETHWGGSYAHVHRHLSLNI